MWLAGIYRVIVGEEPVAEFGYKYLPIPIDVLRAINH